MEKDLVYIELFELYQGLLTDRQRVLFRSHYYYDLSLSEIAEPDGNTRQNVYMAIKKVKEKLGGTTSVNVNKELKTEPASVEVVSAEEKVKKTTRTKKNKAE